MQKVVTQHWKYMLIHVRSQSIQNWQVKGMSDTWGNPLLPPGVHKEFSWSRIRTWGSQFWHWRVLLLTMSQMFNFTLVALQIYIYKGVAGFSLSSPQERTMNTLSTFLWLGNTNRNCLLSSILGKFLSSKTVYLCKVQTHNSHGLVRWGHKKDELSRCAGKQIEQIDVTCDSIGASWLGQDGFSIAWSIVLGNYYSDSKSNHFSQTAWFLENYQLHYRCTFVFVNSTLKSNYV